MNTEINNTAAENFETAKRFLYSFQLLMIGFLIPFLFIVGITNDHHKVTRSNETHAARPTYVSHSNVTVNYGKVLPDQNR